MSDTTSFKIFLAVWNRMQGQGTPAIHFRMAEWLESAWETEDRRLLLLAFRSSGKSTICGLFAAWLLRRNPDLRILVLAADLTLARKMARNVKKIIERHPLTADLKPPRADQWGADRFTVNRNLELRDPSVLAKGITTNITGSRADVIICDDVEVPNTCDTAEKRADLRERLVESDFVLVPGGTVLYIGTPHSWHSIYADVPRGETGEERPFLDGFSRLSIPVTDEEGQSAWPERFTDTDIARMKRSAGPNKFASQMMLTPVNIAEGRLDPSLLRFYGGSLHYSEELGEMYLNGRRIVSASAWWDPSFGGKGSDASVLAAIFTDEHGNRYLHRVEYIRNSECDPAPPAEQQCRKAAFAAQMLRLPSVAVEMNGIGKFLPAILRKEMAKIRAGCAVREMHSRVNKDIRILEAFDAVMAARMLHVHENVRKTPFITEMQEWRPGAKGQRDDGLDAAAGALSLAPVRFPGEHFSGRQEWQGSGRSYNAETDFEV
ncbi:MAG: phage terminase large subunit [Proteobacteria bacterium]|nr:phage terminase large subunit [Pseudomonadota bacterium]